ncbi:MAG TPA: hypothetical protein VNQ76_20345 [Planctomicrobium sp.]|nr:hypothetical protein [Planctomicrobium sp.]
MSLYYNASATKTNARESGLRTRAFALLKTAREGKAPAEPQAMESLIIHAAQQELRPPGNCPS